MSAAATGRTRTVLVFGEGSEVKAIISSVIAHADNYKDNERISFVGPVSFDESTINHTREMLISIVDSILDSLKLDRRNFEISLINPGAVSISDLGVEITGFSADVPMFLAMLSSALEIAIPDDIITTGHIASSDGDIAAVKALYAKIAAASDDKEISRFAYPALGKDKSLEVLSPKEKERATIAVINAEGRLKMTAINDISDLIPTVFTEEAVVLSSLEKGFFSVDCSNQSSNNPISVSVRFLVQNNEARFWNTLERYFHRSDNEKAKRLLYAYSQYHVTRKKYPKDFGRKLIQLLRSLPPNTRKNRINFPLLPTIECISLTQCAAEYDAADIRLLYDATEGMGIWTEPALSAKFTDVNDRSAIDKDQALVDSITTQIDRATLAKAIGVPIDTARATYMLDSLTVNSNEQFHETVTAFYLHLQRHLNRASWSDDIDKAKDDAVALLERSFARKGGIVAAMNEAYSAVHGGMRLVLDYMTEQLKAECQAKHVNRVIKEVIGPLNREAQVRCISALLKRLSSHLPDEILKAGPERFVDHYEAIVKEYVKSLDRINEVFRRF